jgi:hypothetical protein
VEIHTVKDARALRDMTEVVTLLALRAIRVYSGGRPDKAICALDRVGDLEVSITVSKWEPADAPKRPPTMA